MLNRSESGTLSRELRSQRESKSGTKPGHRREKFEVENVKSRTYVENVDWREAGEFLFLGGMARYAGMSKVQARMTKPGALSMSCGQNPPVQPDGR